MPINSIWKQRLLRLVLVCASVVVAIAIGEGIVRCYELSFPLKHSASLNITCKKCSYVYQLNPEYPGISSQNLRNRLVQIPKPKGVYRILFLGDSVTYGNSISQKDTIPAVLEKTLQTGSSKNSIEVINAGVPGYSIYNELQYFVEEGFKYAPDLVLVGLCLNDVIDPLPHWRGMKTALPKAAIPNWEYHQNEILPRFRARGASQWLRITSLFGRTKVNSRSRKFPSRFEHHNGYRVPVFLTTEDDINISVLMDRSSSEWQWLAKNYLSLRNQVAKHGAKFAVVMYPLAYQLLPFYPYRPQKLFKEFCTSQNMQCLDLLTHLEGEDPFALFQTTRVRYFDVWHFTEKGTALSASYLAKFLKAKQLLN